MALIPPFFLDCVLTIGFVTDKEIHYKATGFLLGYLYKDAPEIENRKYHIYVVTNRHVFEGQSMAKLRFNQPGHMPAKLYDFALVNSEGKPQWQGHPDESIDVAVQSINVELLHKDGIRFSFFASDLHVLPFAKAYDLGLSEGDPVFVLGFPFGLIGKERNYALVRHGTIARARDTLDNSSHEFLLDASIFPGNSGGPVITQPELMAIDGTSAIGKSWLIGVVTGYLTFHNVVNGRETRKPQMIFQENSGIATAITIDKAIEAIALAESKLASIPATTIDWAVSSI